MAKGRRSCLLQAQKAQQALGVCLAQNRTQHPQTQRGTTHDPKASIQVYHQMLAMPALAGHLRRPELSMPAKAKVLS